MNNDDLSNKNAQDNQKLSALEKDLDSLMEKAKKETPAQSTQEEEVHDTPQTQTTEEINIPKTPPQPPTTPPVQDTPTAQVSEVAVNTAIKEEPGDLISQTEEAPIPSQEEEFTKGKSKKILFIAISFFVISLAGLAFYMIGAAKQGRVGQTPTLAPSLPTPIATPITDDEVTLPIPESEIEELGSFPTASPSGSPQSTATPSGSPTTTPGI